MTVSKPKLWNPEQPYLYTLLLETPNDIPGYAAEIALLKEHHA